MSFDLVDRPLVWIIVKWPGLIPGENDGPAKPVTHEIECLVELVDKDEYRAIYGMDETGEIDLAKSMSAYEACVRLISNWKGVTESGNPVPFNPERLAALCKVVGFSAGFGEAYSAAISGRVQEREKNSDGSAESGPAAGQ